MEGALDLNKTTITLASATYAVKAERLLARAGIPSELIKLNDVKGDGCTHGIMIYGSDFISAIGLLKENGIPYSVHKR